MTYQPFEIYLFKEATQLNLARYNFKDRLKETLSEKNDPKICFKNGIRFLEMNCTLLYGFIGECIGTGEKVMKNIPLAFDSALILPLILDTGISHDVVTSVLSLLKNDQRESGFWNFFLFDSSQEYDILPEDIDDTSIASMNLFLGKILSTEDCIQISEKMRKQFVYDNDGLIGTFFKPTPGATRKVLWKHFSEVPRIDIGSCLNCFWFFGSIGLDHVLQGQDFQPTMKLLVKVLDEIERNEEIITHARYYTNHNVLLFLMSRFVMASKFGESLLKDKLVKTIMKKLALNSDELTGANTENNETVIELACQIIVALKMNLHKIDTKVKSLILLKMGKMLALQTPDGSFPRAPVYIWTPYKAAAASKAISTAFAVAATKMILNSGCYDSFTK